MSHPTCYEPEVPEETEEAPEAPAGSRETPVLASEECVNDCVSSLGVSTLLGGTIAGLGCLVLTPPGCALVLGGGASLTLAACNDACLELESK